VVSLPLIREGMRMHSRDRVFSGVRSITGGFYMVKKIAVLPGDGIGPEIMEQALRVLEKVDQKFSPGIETEEAMIGGAAIDDEGKALPESTIELCRNSDSILLGAVGGPKWEVLPPDEQPERAALLPMRKIFALYANFRPAMVFKALAGASPLKERVLGGGFDILFIRELTGGIYFGQPEGREGSGAEENGFDTMRYSRREVERIARIAFEAAMKRDKKLVSVDKANVLSCSVLWREVVNGMAARYPEVELSHLYVDAAAMKIVTDPRSFDVVLTGNMFGDILSDEASVLTGSLGMLPSASLADGAFGLYEPIHGSAPDIAGLGIANPTAQILSLAMMFRYSFGMVEAADAVERAIQETIEAGIRTGDIMGDGCVEVSTAGFGDEVLKRL